MTKRPRTLTAAFVRTVGRPGVYGDGRGGRGLSLRVHRTASGRITKTWRQRVRIDGRLTSIGLGPYPEVTLAEARQKALDNSRGVRLGQDPRGGRGVPTFADAAERTIELHRDAWKAGSPLPEQWESTFRLHAARCWTSLRTGSRARTYSAASHQSGTRSPPPGGRPGTGSPPSFAGASAGTTARTIRWTGRWRRCRG